MLFGASIMSNIRFPNGSQHSMYTLKVGQGKDFAESEEGKLLISCFHRYFAFIQSENIYFTLSYVFITF